MDTFNRLGAHPVGGVFVALFGMLYLLLSAPLSLAVSLADPENVELAAKMMLVGWYPTWWVAIGGLSMGLHLAWRLATRQNSPPS